MFYIDDLLKDDDCYLLIQKDKVIGRAPIKEDFSMQTSYTWKDQDNRSLMDLIRDAARQEFRNARQIQGHMQSVTADVTRDALLRGMAYSNISAGKRPLDTTYMTTPTLAHTTSAYALPTMTFIFVNKEDNNAHVTAAEDFLWKVSGASNRNNDNKKINGYAAQTQGPEPGFKFQNSSSSKQDKSPYGLKIKKGNLSVQNISLQGINVEFSRELNLDGFPQAIKITLTYKDTERRYPADTIELVRMSGKKDSLRKKPKSNTKQTTQPSASKIVTERQNTPAQPTQSNAQANVAIP